MKQEINKIIQLRFIRFFSSKELEETVDELNNLFLECEAEQQKPLPEVDLFGGVRQSTLDEVKKWINHFPKSYINDLNNPMVSLATVNELIEKLRNGESF